MEVKNGEIRKEKEEREEELFDVSKVAIAFSEKGNSDEKKEAERTIEKIPDSELIKAVIEQIDLEPRLNIEFRDSIKKGKREAPAAYGYDNKTGEEIGYQINRNYKKGEKSRMNPERKFWHALDVASHEVRHRVQHLNQSLEKLEFEDFEKEELIDKVYTKGLKKVLREMKKRVGRNPREADAVLFALISRYLVRKGVGLSKINEMVRWNKKEIINFLSRIKKGQEYNKRIIRMKNPEEKKEEEKKEERAVKLEREPYPWKKL